jgi:hypothetical protein
LSSSKTVVIYRQGGLGDLVMLLPCIASLHRLGYAVELLCAPPFVSIFRQVPEIKSCRSLNVCKAPMPPTTEGVFSVDLQYRFDFPGVGENARVSDTHRTLLYSQAIAACVPDYQLHDTQPRLLPPGHWADFRKSMHLPEVYAAVHVRGNSPVRRYRHVVQMIAALACEVPVVVVSHEYYHFPDFVLNLTGCLSAEQTAAVVAGAAGFVGPDSGCAHVAGALGVPGVVINGNIPASLRYCFYPSLVVQERPDRLPCQYCLDQPGSYQCGGTANCMSFPVQVVVDRILAAMGREGVGTEAYPSRRRLFQGNRWGDRAGFIYSQSQYEDRILELWMDGTVGEGAFDANESWWTVGPSPAGPMIVLGGGNGEAVWLLLKEEGRWEGAWHRDDRGRQAALTPTGKNSGDAAAAALRWTSAFDLPLRLRVMPPGICYRIGRNGVHSATLSPDSWRPPAASLRGLYESGRAAEVIIATRGDLEATPLFLEGDETVDYSITREAAVLLEHFGLVCGDFCNAWAEDGR